MAYAPFPVLPLYCNGGGCPWTAVDDTEPVTSIGRSQWTSVDDVPRTTDQKVAIGMLATRAAAKPTDCSNGRVGKAEPATWRGGLPRIPADEPLVTSQSAGP